MRSLILQAFVAAPELNFKIIFKNEKFKRNPYISICS